MSTKNKCQPKTNVNQKQMSTKNKCQPKPNFNQKQMSTKNTQLNTTELNQTKPNSTQPNGCHTQVTQPCNCDKIFVNGVLSEYVGVLMGHFKILTFKGHKTRRINSPVYSLLIKAIKSL